MGLAPGTAFGESGEGYLRLCYARNPQILEEAVARISAALPGLVQLTFPDPASQDMTQGQSPPRSNAIRQSPNASIVDAKEGRRFAAPCLGASRPDPGRGSRRTVVSHSWNSGRVAFGFGHRRHVVGPDRLGRAMPKALTDLAMLSSGATMGAAVTPAAIAAIARYPASLVLLVIGVVAITACSALWLDARHRVGARTMRCWPPCQEHCRPSWRLRPTATHRSVRSRSSRISGCSR